MANLKSIMSCVRCGKDTPQTDPPTAYCPACKEWIEQDQKTRGAKSKPTTSGRTYSKATPAHEAPKTKDSPVVITTDKQRCGLCGNPQLSTGYGFCCYGLGSYIECEACKYILNFLPDK